MEDGLTHLTTVLEGTHDELRGGSLNIDIFSDDAGVVAAKLEVYTFEGLAASSHDLLTGSNASGKTDLGNTGVLGEHGTKLVIAAEDLDDTGREYGLAQLDGLERCVRGER